MNLAQYEDFASLYQFANMKQRRFLDLYFMHYEIGIVKTCLRNGAGRREAAQDLSGFKEFLTAILLWIWPSFLSAVLLMR